MEQSLIGLPVIVRTYSAGVHFGILRAADGKTVRLENSRNLWRWRGANSLNEIAVDGCAMEWTRISKAVPSAEFTEAISIFPLSEKAWANLQIERWGK